VSASAEREPSLLRRQVIQAIIAIAESAADNAGMAPLATPPISQSVLEPSARAREPIRAPSAFATLLISMR
jgi:hypothetical protein